MAAHEERARHEPERRPGRAPAYRVERGEEREVEVSPALRRRMSWGAVFAGFIVAMVVQMILTLLGLAIGLGAIDLTTGDFSGLGTGAAIWAGLTALISLFVGGLVAGYLAGRLTRGNGMLHGVLVWGLTMLLTTFALTSGLGTLLGGVFSVTGQAVSGLVGTAGQLGAAAVQRPGGVPTSEQEVIQLLQRRGLSQQEAQATVNDLRQTGVQIGQQVQQVQRQAPQVATQVAGTLSTALWITLLVAVLSLAAAVAGAAITARS
ncbi:MAG TPA: hypothetical protein VF192_03555 [Longimicrobiales bacterium]